MTCETIYKAYIFRPFEKNKSLKNVQFFLKTQLKIKKQAINP